MTTEAKIQLTSTELGTLWMTYMSTTGMLVMNDLFKDKTIDKEAQNILASYANEGQNIKSEIINIFNAEKSVIPMGFNEIDSVKESLPLFDDIFNIMFLREMMKLNLGHGAVNISMSFMKEVQDIFKLNSEVSYKYYVMTTNYLLEKGVLASSPYVNMPKQVEFIEDKKYISGISLFSDKRTLNTIEVGYINEAIQTNIFGMQLMTGFAQVSKESEVKKHFLDGKELSKKIVTELSALLLQSDIQAPRSPWAGNATDSTQICFSDKLMMSITNLISRSALGYNALGTSFSMRSDLHVKLANISKSIFDYAKKGGQIMIDHKWMEEPPQMEVPQRCS